MAQSVSANRMHLLIPASLSLKTLNTHHDAESRLHRLGRRRRSQARRRGRAIRRWRCWTTCQAHGWFISSANSTARLHQFKPSLINLINDQAAQASSSTPETEAAPQSSTGVKEEKQNRREGSVSPRPITLKLGTSRSAVSRAASYSDSSDEETEATPAAKKAKTMHPSSTSPKKSAVSVESSKLTPSTSGQQSTLGPATTPSARVTSPSPLASGSMGHPLTAHAPGGKSYDWLPPSTVGSSHQGPPRPTPAAPTLTPTPAGGSGAPATSEADASSRAGSRAGTPTQWPTGSPSLSVDSESKSKRAPAKKRERDAGPGKAWRKGIKKWVFC